MNYAVILVIWRNIVRDFVKSPGDYEFLVEYRTYLSDDLAREYVPRRDAVFWSRERAP